MWKDLTRSDRIVLVTFALGSLIGIAAIVEQYFLAPADGRERVDSVLGTAADIVLAPIPIPAIVIALALVVLGWAGIRAWPRKSTAPTTPARVEDQSPRDAGGNIVIDGGDATGNSRHLTETVLTDRQRTTLELFGKLYGEWYAASTIAKKSALPLLQVQALIDELHELRLLDYSEGGYMLSSRGVALASRLQRDEP